MKLSVQIDSHSGFCGGVIRAIGQAENFLHRGGTLYSLGSLVHNEAELERLGRQGLVTIDKKRFATLREADVIIRAHGEPPETYRVAEANGIRLIDCTCPVVLRLQKRIREAYARIRPLGGSVVIFGKVGHAEVLGLVGQVDGDAVVVENREMLLKALEDGRIGLSGPLEVFSQTTMRPAGYAEIGAILREKVAGEVTVHDTICSQVSSRHDQLADFARNLDVIIFVSGTDSSNGKVLCELCLKANPRTHHIVSPEGLDSSWFRDGDRVGVCGATSTPKWLLEAVADAISALGD